MSNINKHICPTCSNDKTELRTCELRYHPTISKITADT